MSVLDAFIYDPLVEWEDEKRKLVSEKLPFKFGIRLFFFLLNDFYYRSGSLLKGILQKTLLTCNPLLNLR